MEGRIAVYDRPGSYSDRWKVHLHEMGLPFLLVDIFDHCVIDTLRREGVTVLLAHPPMASAATSIAARAVLFAAEQAGIVVFPGFREFWHFDDKVAQKYLFESLGVPHPRMHVFYSEQDARRWIGTVETWPKVFKLRCGAGSQNVKLVRNASDAYRLAKTMFGRGMNANDAAVRDFRGKFQRHARNRDWFAVARRLPTTTMTLIRKRKELPRERGYVLFQDFIPGNQRDIRINIIGGRAFGFSRWTRENDFRASGSGRIEFDPNLISKELVRAAFETASKLDTRCIAIDLVEEPLSKSPLVIEVSFGFKTDVANQCVGYWTRDLEFHAEPVRTEDWIVEAVIQNAEPSLS